MEEVEAAVVGVMATEEATGEEVIAMAEEGVVAMAVEVEDEEVLQDRVSASSVGRPVTGRETARMEVEVVVEVAEGMAPGGGGGTSMETGMGEIATLDAQVVLIAVTGVEGIDLAHMTAQVAAGVVEAIDIKLDQTPATACQFDEELIQRIQAGKRVVQVR